MSETNPLIEFETEYPKLYEILVNGNPIYAALRDGVNVTVNGGENGTGGNTDSDAGRVSVRRVIDSFVKLKRFKKAKSLIFTSSVYRRDKGRNLAVEFLMDKYPDAVVFEWPSRNEGFDFAYFKDALKVKYCPLEWYLIKYKLYMLLHKKEYNRYCDECRAKLAEIFPEKTDGLSENHRRAIEYIKAEMPNSYAVTVISQNIFRKIFKKFQNVEVAVDFWGSARENIIPVLTGKPQSVELQHGIITKIHPGYIYPKYVKDLELDFFKRTLLVYGNKTKEMLTEDSIFDPDRVEVIGNPRIIKYKQEFLKKCDNKKYLLFLSGALGDKYYEVMIDYLSAFQEQLDEDVFWKDYKIAIKLHPRENNANLEMFKKTLPQAEFFDNTAQLYELIGESVLVLTMASTALYEAAKLGVPTVVLKYYFKNITEIYGFDPIVVSDPFEVAKVMEKLKDPQKYNSYLSYLEEQTNYYM